MFRCSPPPGSVRIPHPILSLDQFDKRLVVSGTFKGKKICVCMVLDDPVAKVDWTFVPHILNGNNETLPSPEAVKEVLEDLALEISSFLFKKMV